MTTGSSRNRRRRCPRPTTRRSSPPATRTLPGARRRTSGRRSRSTTRRVPPAITMATAGFNVTHVYGLTEVYGPAVVNEWHAAWEALDGGKQAALKARQGVRYPALEDLAVMDPETMTPVPADGATLGEVMFRGNIV